MCDRVLFLDVDGVLNMYGCSYYSFGYDNLGNMAIEIHLMKRLEFILERIPNMKIVVSSSWSMKNLKRVLERNRFKYLDRIIGRTSRVKEDRGEQILDYVEEHNVKDYIILEDEIRDVVKYIGRSNIIEVDMNEGMSNKNAVDLIVRFNRLDTYNDTKHSYNKENYDMFISLGYRPHVSLDYEDGLFKYIELHNNNLCMICKK